MKIATAWTCDNPCSTFETIQIPIMCPHCGSRELHQHGKSLREYTRFENETLQDA